jgi:hypothetical protein
MNWRRKDIMGGNKGSIDDLLKISLSSSEKPCESLNWQLHADIKKALKRKEISIWWIPMVISIFISVFFSAMAYLIVSNIYIQITICTISLLATIFNIVLTAIGVRYFELKKGAVINI